MLKREKTIPPMKGTNRDSSTASLRKSTIRDSLVNVLSSPSLIFTPTSVLEMVLPSKTLFLGRPSLPDTAGSSLPSYVYRPSLPHQKAGTSNENATRISQGGVQKCAYSTRKTNEVSVRRIAERVTGAWKTKATDRTSPPPRQRSSSDGETQHNNISRLSG